MVTADGWSGPVEIGEIAGLTVTLTAAPPGTVDTSTLIYGLGFSATIPASATGTVDRFYRLEWTITCADGTVTLQHQIAHVVRMQFSDAVTDAEAKRYVAANWPGLAGSKDAGFFRGVTDRANARVRNLIQASGDFPHMIGDPSLFVDSGAGLAALRLDEGVGHRFHDLSGGVIPVLDLALDPEQTFLAAARQATIVLHVLGKGVFGFEVHRSVYCPPLFCSAVSHTRSMRSAQPDQSALRNRSGLG